MQTFKMIVGNEWTQVSEGTAFGIQSAGSNSVLLFIGDSEPSQDEENFLILSPSGDRSFSLDPEGTPAYIRTMDEGYSAVRGWRA